MRLVHRYLGYLLAGIMAVYALTGIVLIYRDQDGFKKEVHHQKQLASDLSEKKLGKELKIKNFEITHTEDNVHFFKQGTYDTVSGKADYKVMEYPYVLDKMVSLHKAKSENKLAALNVFFGFALLIYVITSFFLFLPKSPQFKKGMLVVLAGFILGFILLFIEI